MAIGKIDKVIVTNIIRINRNLSEVAPIIYCQFKSNPAKLITLESGEYQLDNVR